MFGAPLPEHKQRFSKVQRFRLLLESDPTHLTREGLIRVLKHGPESIRPKNYHRQKKAVLLDAIQAGLKQVAIAHWIAPLIRNEYRALKRQRGKTDSA